MKRSFYPLSAVQAVPHNGRIRFLHPREPYDVGNFCEVIWAILGHCNGYIAVHQIVNRVQKQFPEESPDTIRAIITDLRELGVLVDSRSAYTHFHLLSGNPGLYSRNLTASQVAEYTRSRRLAVKDGRRIDLGRSKGRVAALVTRRRSCRTFADKPLNVAQIGHLCTTAYSIRDHPTLKPHNSCELFYCRLIERTIKPIT